MSKNTHTPGPWQADEWRYTLKEPHRRELKVENGKNVIAHIEGDLRVDPDQPENPYTLPECEAQANAALIAAAPELLAAARAALAYLDEYRPKGGVMKNFEQYNHHENGAVKPLRAAIAKAEGGE